MTKIKLKKLTIFDIDGLIVENSFNDPPTINTKFYNIYKNQKLHKNIINIINITANESDIAFVTGRSKEYKNITLKLLSDLKINYKVYFSDFVKDYSNWSYNNYLKFKSDICNKISKDYNIIVILDDIRDVLIKVRDNFNYDNKTLFLIYAKFINKINNIIVVELLG